MHSPHKREHPFSLILCCWSLELRIHGSRFITGARQDSGLGFDPVKVPMEGAKRPPELRPLTSNPKLWSCRANNGPQEKGSGGRPKLQGEGGRVEAWDAKIKALAKAKLEAEAEGRGSSLHV